MKNIKWGKTEFGFVVRALRYRNYRLFFGGQAVSLIGTWMQGIAVSWLVFRMTNSVLMLGAIGFASQVPAFLATPFAGVMVDKWDRHKVLIITQVLAMAQAAILAILFFTNTITLWHVVALSIFLGLISAFEMPTRHAFVVELVDRKEDLGNAIALNSSIFNGARFVGPFFAGLLIALSGEGICFILNALSYVAVIAALCAMRVQVKREMPRDTHVLQGLKDGFKYAADFAPIRYILTIVGVGSFLGMPYAILLPVFTRDVFHDDPRIFGFLMAASGIGALAGAIYLASRKTVRGLTKKIVSASFLFGIGLMLFAFSRSLWLSLVLILLAGFGMIVQMASCNTILQTIVDDNKRGRIMSFYTMAFIGMVPFGSLLIGALAQRIGGQPTMLISGLSCIAGGVFFASKLPEIRKAIRPIYERKGIIPIENAEVESTVGIVPRKN